MNKSPNKKYFFNAVIVVLIMTLFRFLPPFGSMTSLGMTILGIFLGALWGWINCDLIWPSVLAITMAGMTGYFEGGVAAAFTSAISQPTLQLILWLCVFSAVLTITGISNQLANRLISSKMCNGHPWTLSVAIFLIALICSSFGAGFAAILVSWEFVYTIAKEAGYTRKDKWPRMMIVGVIVANALGGVMMPFIVGVVATYGYLATASEGVVASYNYMAYLVFSLSICICSTAVYFLANRVFIRPDLSKLKDDINVGLVQPFTQQQKIAIGGLAALIVVTVLPSCLPACGLKTVLNNLGTTTMILILICILTFLRTKDGKPIFTFKELANNGIFWPMMFMVATAITMGGVLANQQCGFTATLVNVFSPLFEGKSPVVFIVFVIIFTTVLTNVVNNAVAGAIMVPLMYSFAAKIGANPILITGLICFASNMGILLPCASPSGAMLASNKEWVNMGDIFKYGLIGIVSIVLILILVGIPVGGMLFAI